MNPRANIFLFGLLVWIALAALVVTIPTLISRVNWYLNPAELVITPRHANNLEVSPGEQYKISSRYRMTRNDCVADFRGGLRYQTEFGATQAVRSSHQGTWDLSDPENLGDMPITYARRIPSTAIPGTKAVDYVEGVWNCWSGSVFAPLMAIRVKYEPVTFSVVAPGESFLD